MPFFNISFFFLILKYFQGLKTVHVMMTSLYLSDT